MTVHGQTQTNALSSSADSPPTLTPTSEKILCNHCGRTASNGVKCRGICVADSDY